MKPEIRFTTFDYAKTIEIWTGQTIPTIRATGIYHNLSHARRAAEAYISHNPNAFCKIKEIKLKVHEYYVRRNEKEA
jgi:hypothetical protein